MNNIGPIIIIEDDADDQIILKEIFEELQIKNELLLFSDGVQALLYLEDTTVKPFLVISDINLPLMSGMELRSIIYQHQELRIKCIPYIFLSTSSSVESVSEAYSLAVQGYFIKPDNYNDLKVTIQSIFDYWQIGKRPDLVKAY